MTAAAAGDELDVLLGQLVDDLLDERDLARLGDLLSQDAEARRRYRSFLALHSSLHWDYAAAARCEAVDGVTAPLPSLRRRWWPPIAAAAAVLVAVLGLGLWSRAGTGSPTITASEVAGGVLTWSDGARRRVLFGGEMQGPGQYRLEGAAASATLRFGDGSMVSLAGECDLTIADDGQKRLQLMAGTLTAEVQPQPAHQPLLVRTGTAGLEVVGTRFTVTASATQTTLDVEHGRVHLERLVDGTSTEVGEQQFAVASLDAASALQASARNRPPTAWALDLGQPLPPSWVGLYAAPTPDQPALVRAAPYLAGRSAQGAPLTHFGVRIGSGQAGERPFVRLLAGSHVILRFRTARSDGRSHVDVMVCTHTASGAFGGTFTAPIPPERLSVDAGGWCTARLAVEEFRSTRPSHPSMVDLDAVFILPRTFAAQIELEVAALSVVPP